MPGRESDDSLEMNSGRSAWDHKEAAALLMRRGIDRPFDLGRVAHGRGGQLHAQHEADRLGCAQESGTNTKQRVLYDRDAIYARGKFLAAELSICRRSHIRK